MGPFDAPDHIPDHPGRPNHPDFWAVSDVLLAHDGRTDESGMKVEATIGAYIDAEVLMYVATQRAAIQLHNQGIPQTPPILALLASMWIDAFIAGCGYTERKATRP